MDIGKIVGTVMASSLLAYSTMAITPSMPKESKLGPECRQTIEMERIFKEDAKLYPTWTGISDKGVVYTLWTHTSNTEWGIEYSPKEGWKCLLVNGTQWFMSSSEKPKDMPSSENCQNGYSLDEITRQHPNVISWGKPSFVKAGIDRYTMKTDSKFMIYSSSVGINDKDHAWALVVKIPIFVLIWITQKILPTVFEVRK